MLTQGTYAFELLMQGSKLFKYLILNSLFLRDFPNAKKLQKGENTVTRKNILKVNSNTIKFIPFHGKPNKGNTSMTEKPFTVRIRAKHLRYISMAIEVRQATSL